MKKQNTEIKMKRGHILKQEIMDGLKERIEKNSLIILTDTSNLTVSEITRLRRELSKIGGTYQVAKNRLFARQANDLGFPISSRLTGPTGFLFAQDASLACKTLFGFIKKEKKPAIKFAFLAKKRLEKQDIERIAALPAKEILISQVISQIQAPLSGLVGALSGIIRNFLYTLEAIKNKKNG